MAELHVIEAGPVDAPVVALVHGSMDRSGGFTKVARLLADRYRVLRYDRRGYARSSEVTGTFSMAEQVGDLVQVLDGRPAHLVGHSYGGDVVLATADRHPALVRSVGVYEPPLSWLPWWPSGTAGGQAVTEAGAAGAEAAAERFLRRMLGDRVWELLPGGTRAERLAEGVALVGELTDLRTRAPFDPARVDVPVLVARGEVASVHRERAATVLGEWFGTVPLVIAGADHGAHRSHAEAFAGFVDAVVRAARPSAG